MTTDVESVRGALQRLNPEFYKYDAAWPALIRIERVVEAVLAADSWWCHEAHGLHDDGHHAAHPMDLCVPVLSRGPVFAAALGALRA